MSNIILDAARYSSNTKMRVVLCLVVVFIVAVICVEPSDDTPVYNQWFLQNTNDVEPRYGAAAVYHKEKNQMIIYGGADGKITLPDVLVYDIATKKISKPTIGGDAPYARSFHTGVAVAHKAFFFGGKAEDGRYLDCMAVLDMNDLKWLPIEIPKAPAPSGRAGHTTVISHDMQWMYLFGGWNDDDGSLNDLWKINFQHADAQWKQLAIDDPRVPGPRANHSAAMMEANGEEDVMYIFSGMEGDVVAYADLWEYSVKSDSWKHLKPYGYEVSSSYYHFSAVVRKDADREVMITTAGGTDFVLMYHPADNFWSKWDPVAEQMAIHTAAGIATDDSLYTFGGLSWSQVPTNKVFKYTWDPCALYTECDSCMSEKSKLCGWCSRQGACMTVKDNEGSAPDYCPGKWRWDRARPCPLCASGDELKRPQTCGDCTKDLECGWCSEKGLCSEGDEEEAFYEWMYCSTWRHGKGDPSGCIHCPTRYKNCGDCAADHRCGWCWADNKCYEGSPVRPPKGKLGHCDYGWDAYKCAACETYTNCSSCNSRQLQGEKCGWCHSTGKCIHGDGGRPYQKCDMYSGATCVDCGLEKDCASCNNIGITQGVCGWCNDHDNKGCFLGDVASPLLPTVCRDWRYSAQRCMTRQDHCHAQKSCKECQDLNYCGWCDRNRKCLLGQKSGSSLPDPPCGGYWHFGSCPGGGHGPGSLLQTVLTFVAIFLVIAVAVWGALYGYKVYSARNTGYSGLIDA